MNAQTYVFMKKHINTFWLKEKVPYLELHKLAPVMV